MPADASAGGGRPRWSARATRTLTVLVVTHDSAPLLEAFFASLPAGLDGITSHEVVVVDNASHDDTLGAITDLAPAAKVVRRDDNLGYAAGINAGLAVAEPSRATLVLNPDVRLRPGCARRLLDALAHPATGIAVPRLVDEHGRLQPSLRRDPTVVRALTAAVLGGDRAGRIGALGEVVTDPAAYASPRTVDWASGAAMLVSRGCLDAVGGWDESFFLYSEEVEFTQQARARGFAVRYVPDAEAVHIGGAAPTTPRLWRLMAVNRVVQYAHRHSAPATAAFWGAVALGEALRAAAGSERSREALRGLVAALRSGRVVTRRDRR